MKNPAEVRLQLHLQCCSPRAGGDGLDTVCSGGSSLSSFLLLVVGPGAPSSVLAPTVVAMHFAPSSFLLLV